MTTRQGSRAHHPLGAAGDCIAPPTQGGLPIWATSDLQCGLDIAHVGADVATQEQAFRQQLQLGRELGRPISVTFLQTCTPDSAMSWTSIHPIAALGRRQVHSAPNSIGSVQTGCCCRSLQVHCVRAYGNLLAAIQELGPFPAGLVLHSFAGPVEMVAPLAKVVRAPQHNLEHPTAPLDYVHTLLVAPLLYAKADCHWHLVYGGVQSL
jgi:TatD related DNase